MKIKDGLTIVILTYNSESTISECLDSLAAQNNQNFKLIIVDDESTDNTIKLIKTYCSKLSISILKNGSHSIAIGRNIGLQTSETEFVAFMDSDDSALPEWTETIIKSFEKNQYLAIISGVYLTDYSTNTSQAIALNDAAIRELFYANSFPFYGGNCAFNRKLVGSYFFNEDFKYSEDLEIASRIKQNYQWQHIPSMRINHQSRDNFKEYACQMFRYSQWKFYYGYKVKDYRFIDFIPLSIIILSIILSIIFGSLFPLLTILLFSFAESIFIIIYKRPSFIISILTFPAWLTKNVSWSVGLFSGIYIINTKKHFRDNIKKTDTALLNVNL